MPDVYDLYQQGVARLADGNAAAAAEILELAVEAEPRKASLREALARAYFATQHVTRAREQFEEALALDPTDDYAHFCAGRCHERQGELRPAVKHYRLALALSGREDYADALARVEQRIR